MSDSNVKELADKHLASYMKEAVNQGVDSEKAVLGMLAGLFVQIEHKHGKQQSKRLLSEFTSAI